MKKLTKETFEKLVKAAEAGNYRRAMAKAVGVGESTLRLWMQKGRLDAEAKKGTLYARLRKAILEGEAKAEIELTGIIMEASKKDSPSAWKAAAWFLERRFPKRWALSQRINLKGKMDGLNEGPSITELRRAVAGIMAIPGVADRAEEALLKEREEQPPPAGSPPGAVVPSATTPS